MMKLSFSTLSCTQWTIERTVSTANEFGYEGVEIRGVLGEFDLPNCPAFATRRLGVTRRMFADAGLEIVWLYEKPFAWSEAHPDTGVRCLMLPWLVFAGYCLRRKGSRLVAWARKPL